MNIACERMLWQYWDEEANFREAFVRWATDLTSGYDKYRGVTEVPEHYTLAKGEIVLDEAALARAAALAGPAQSSAYRVILRPLHCEGRTIRQLAEAANITLRQAVAALVAPSACDRFCEYVAMEEELLANCGPKASWSEINSRYGFAASAQCAQKIAKRHGLYQRRSRAVL